MWRLAYSMYSGEKSTPRTCLTWHRLVRATDRQPVPQPTSRTLSPSVVPAKSRKGSARRRLQRPISNSYPSPSAAVKVEEGVMVISHQLRCRIAYSLVVRSVETWRRTAAPSNTPCENLTTHETRVQV